MTTPRCPEGLYWAATDTLRRCDLAGGHEGDHVHGDYVWAPVPIDPTAWTPFDEPAGTALETGAIR